MNTLDDNNYIFRSNLIGYNFAYQEAVKYPTMINIQVLMDFSARLWDQITYNDISKTIYANAVYNSLKTTVSIPGQPSQSLGALCSSFNPHHQQSNLTIPQYLLSNLNLFNTNGLATYFSSLNIKCLAQYCPDQNETLSIQSAVYSLFNAIQEYNNNYQTPLTYLQNTLTNLAYSIVGLYTYYEFNDGYLTALNDYLTFNLSSSSPSLENIATLICDPTNGSITNACVVQNQNSLNTSLPNFQALLNSLGENKSSGGSFLSFVQNIMLNEWGIIQKASPSCCNNTPINCPNWITSIKAQVCPSITQI